ncbi:MAG: hypothetical protein AB8B77_07590 [Alphaproteobacteria bacterium]
MVGRISTSGINLHTLLSMQRNKELSDVYTNQMTTGYKFQRFQDYGTDMKRIVDYENIISERQGYIRAIDLVEPMTSSYEQVLAQLAEVSGQVMRASDPLSVKRDSFPGETETLSTNWMIDFEANLNIQIGGRYLFAGTNYTEAPVKDMREMEIYSAYDSNKVEELIEYGFARTASYVTPVLDADGNTQDDGNGGILVSAPKPLGAEDTIETANIVAQTTYKRPVLDASGQPQFTADGHVILTETDQSYHYKFEGDQTENSRSWTKMSMSINDLQVFPYSISANETGLQMLSDALILLKTAAQTFSEDDDVNWEVQRNFLRQAYNKAEEARSEIRKLEVRNGGAMTEFAEAKEFHNRFISLSQVSRDNLKNADETEAALNLSALNTQIEASYTTIAKRADLSLTNYLR